MKSKDQKLENIAGQINGIKKMMEEGKDCVDILNQLKAARSAINSVMQDVIEEQMETCVKGLSEKDKKNLLKIRNYVSTN